MNIPFALTGAARIVADRFPERRAQIKKLRLALGADHQVIEKAAEVIDQALTELGAAWDRQSATVMLSVDDLAARGLPREAISPCTKVGEDYGLSWVSFYLHFMRWRYDSPEMYLGGFHPKGASRVDVVGFSKPIERSTKVGYPHALVWERPVMLQQPS